MKENRLLKYIRYIPSLFIIIFSILITYFISSIYNNSLEKDKTSTQLQYIVHEKNRIKNNMETISLYIENEKKSSYVQLQKHLRMQVNSAYSIVNSIYNDNVGIRSKEEILKRVKTALKNIRFNNGRGYFFIYNEKARNVFHPTNKELEGTSYLDKDALGKYGVKNLVDITKVKKEGYVTWHFLKPNSGKHEYKKLGFVKKFQPYGWYIATGEYIEAFEKELKQKILNNLRVLKFKDDGYMYVLDKEGKIIANKNRELEGLNIFNINKLERKSTGFFNFLQSPLNTKFIEYKLLEDIDEHNKKIAYLKKIEDFNWIIGTGFDLKTINKDIATRHEIIEQNYQQTTNTILMTSFVITLLLLVISYFISWDLEKSFLNYKRESVKKEQEKMKDQLRKLRCILDNLPMMIGYKDTNNNVITVNQRSAQFMGKSVEELSNVPMKNIFPNDYKRYHQLDQEVMQTKEAKLAFIEMQIVQDKKVSVEVSVVPVFNSKKEVVNLIVFMTDVTEKLSLQKENNRKQKLLYQQNKLATMGEMIGNIAHQWRQPLSTISTASTGIKLKKEMGILEDDEFYNSMELVNDSVQYLSQTIEDFRNFFEPNKSLSKQFFISSPINRTIKLVSASFLTKNIEIIKDVQELELESMESEIVQVLINLLNNAKDALISTREEKRLIFINTYKKGSWVYVEVKDNAYGIKEEILEKIFEPYFTTKHQSQGTGIGLYMSYEITTKLLKGILEVENEEFIYSNQNYQGAKFTLKLPLKK